MSKFMKLPKGATFEVARKPFTYKGFNVPPGAALGKVYLNGKLFYAVSFGHLRLNAVNGVVQEKVAVYIAEIVADTFRETYQSAKSDNALAPWKKVWINTNTLNKWIRELIARDIFVLSDAEGLALMGCDSAPMNPRARVKNTSLKDGVYNKTGGTHAFCTFTPELDADIVKLFCD